MATPRYRVYLRGADYALVDELDAWRSLKAIPRFNGVGTWSMELASDTPSALLVTKQSGIVITRDDEVIFSGSATEHARTATTLRVRGYCDNALLLAGARPDPSISDPPFVSEYDVRTGVASTIMSEFVYFNIGAATPVAWRIPALVIGADPLLGATITGRARLDPLIVLLGELAKTPIAGGLGFRILQSSPNDDTVEFRVYAPRDQSAVAAFGIELGTAQDFEDVWSAPPYNYVYVAADDGLRNERTIVAGGDATSIAEAGRRIEAYVQANGVTDPTELAQRLAEALAGATASRKVTVTPFDVPSLTYGSGTDQWDLGDLCSFQIGSEVFVDLVREVEIDLTTDGGARITPMIGQAGTSNDDPLAGQVQAVQGRLEAWQKNWTVPKDSIIRDMLVPVLKQPIGEVKWLAGSTVPAGYLAANGASYLRSAYPALFAEIGAIWGAADGSHFNVPDLRNRSPIGSGSTYSLGQLVGATTTSIPDHAHTGAVHTHPGSHSHGLGNHTHTSQAHTHPGSHSHGIGSHVHAFDHSHDVDIAPFNSGGESTFAATFSTYPSSVTNVSHNHSINPPNTTTTSPDHLNTGNPPSGSTAADTNAPAASYSGSPSAPTPTSSDADSNVFAASYSGSSGLAGATVASIVHPSAGLMPVIYAGI